MPNGGGGLLAVEAGAVVTLHLGSLSGTAISVPLQGCAITYLRIRAWSAPQRRTRVRVARGARRRRVRALHNRRENAGKVDEH